uniref:Adaptin_N domain-containing protein n=1 Tax=Macrostomum lignano TaxID=282301 RepID=A0A1I8IIA9_9PLAT
LGSQIEVINGDRPHRQQILASPRTGWRSVIKQNWPTIWQGRSGLAGSRRGSDAARLSASPESGRRPRSDRCCCRRQGDLNAAKPKLCARFGDLAACFCSGWRCCCCDSSSSGSWRDTQAPIRRCMAATIGTAGILEKLYDVMKNIEMNKKTGKNMENAALFKVILQAAKGDSTSKRLASQFIARLFKDFPDEQKTAYNALIDLVEDEDTLVRRQVISDLPKLCKDVPIFAPKVADVLVQVLQADDSQELALANQSLLHVIGAHPAEALTGILDQLTQPETPDLCRERALRLLAGRVQQVPLSAKLEELLVERLQPLIDSASDAEFISLVQLLASLSCMQTLTGRQRLLDIVGKKAALAGPFQPADAALLARLRECIKQALPLLSKNINAKPFVIYFLDKVLPVIDKVPAELAGETPRLDLLKSFAELSSHSGGNFAATDAQLTGLLRRLTERLALPSDADVDTDADTPAAAVAAAAADAASLTHSECLLYALHQTARTRPDFLADRAELLADLRKRLQLLHLAAQSYQRSHKPAAGEAKCRLADNIGALMKDLFRNPPTYKAELTLSWKPLPPPPPSPQPIAAPAVKSPTAAPDQQRKRPASQQDWGRGGGGGQFGYGKRGFGGGGGAGRGSGGRGGGRGRGGGYRRCYAQIQVACCTASKRNGAVVLAAHIRSVMTRRIPQQLVVVVKARAVPPTQIRVPQTTRELLHGHQQQVGARQTGQPDTPAEFILRNASNEAAAATASARRFGPGPAGAALLKCGSAGRSFRQMPWKSYSWTLRVAGVVVAVRAAQIGKGPSENCFRQPASGQGDSEDWKRQDDFSLLKDQLSLIELVGHVHYLCLGVPSRPAVPPGPILRSLARRKNPSDASGPLAATEATQGLGGSIAWLLKNESSRTRSAASEADQRSRSAPESAAGCRDCPAPVGAARSARARDARRKPVPSAAEMAAVAVDQL